MFSIHMGQSGLREMEVAAQRMSGGIARAIDDAVETEANLLQQTIVDGLENQAPGGRTILPLSPMTLVMRRLPSYGNRKQTNSTKALIAGRELLNGVKSKRYKAMWYTVGVHREERNTAGMSLEYLATIHEEGTRAYKITVTPRMHAFSIFLVSQGILKAPWPVGKVITRKIPARPFLAPSYMEWSQEAPDRFQRSIDEFARDAQKRSA
ncbi:MAG: hypothetical protein PHX83_17445 [Acidobacteriia bacterium]|nr:hypothetical protein [Terriglobia bacterium]